MAVVEQRFITDIKKLETELENEKDLSTLQCNVNRSWTTERELGTWEVNKNPQFKTEVEHICDATD